MRRKSAEVVANAPQVRDRIRSFQDVEEAHRCIRLLEPLVGDPRRMRLKDVISRRLASVSVVFDAPYDPHNGAAVIRSCEAFGVQHVFVVERGTTFMAAASVAKGAHKWIDVHRYSDVPSALATLRATGATLVGAFAEGKLRPEALADMERVAIVLGNERNGISEQLFAACSESVSVPMRGFIDSQRERNRRSSASRRDGWPLGRSWGRRSKPALCAWPVLFRATR